MLLLASSRVPSLSRYLVITSPRPTHVEIVYSLGNSSESCVAKCQQSHILPRKTYISDSLNHHAPTSVNMASTSIFQRPLTPTSSRSSSGMSDAGTTLEESTGKSALSTALHVIRTERDALTALEDLYETDSVAQDGLSNAVNVVSKSVSCGGKVVVSGVGKSGKIGMKIVATMNSFGIKSAFLHPTEALHGDLGMIGEVSANPPLFELC